ncbi:MAG: ABC transporter permease [Ardenticatenaceae bacterium]|nr:ABC transporter permease [Anaerolineales bacterium]MCB8938588.1 ABC transporter permease [Ardenticatenaceae bacterium]MCB8973721.1 ABC transporter permease [Ardenticatenaceae bacterium]
MKNILSFLAFALRRLLIIPLTLLVVTMVLYSFFMSVPAEDRASLYLPPNTPRVMTPEKMENLINRIIEENGLNDPFLQQYGRWATNLLRGDWGYSPTFNAPVLELLQRRTAVTLELAFYALLTLIPLGIASGVVTGWRPGSRRDGGFRTTAFIATSIPPFILGMFLLSIFYVGLGWFPPGRTGLLELTLLASTSSFQPITGFLTIDGLLNGRLDVTQDALRHLALPVFTLGLAHWATLGRVTRVAVINETSQSYVMAAMARGLRQRQIVWRHVFRNVLLPALTSSSLSAASLITGVFVVEVVFDYKGLSDLVTASLRGYTPDSALAMGFAIYSVLLVLPIMLLLDMLKALADPRIREADTAKESAR